MLFKTSKPELNTVVNTIQHERKTMYIEKDKLQRTGKYAEETQEINATWESFECIKVTLVFVICFIFTCIVNCHVNKVIQNKLDVIQLVQQLNNLIKCAALLPGMCICYRSSVHKHRTC